MKRWSERGDVERARIYTEGTLYLMLWIFPWFLAPGFIDELQGRPGLLAGTALALVLTAAAGSVSLQATMALYPEPGPVAWVRHVPLFVTAAGATALALAMRQESGFGILLLLSMMVSWSLGGIRDDRLAAALVALSALFPFLADFRPGAALVGGLVGLFFIATARASLWMLKVIVELDRARGIQSALAVAEERLRFSRDVHDVLGRRLSTIAVQAELGSALAARGDDRATDLMREVRDTAHLALREARELARGYRPVDLTQELDGARSLLRSAGIAMDTEVDDLPDAWHESAAWVVRESITNVLRHSSATRVTVAYGDRVLRVSNDGTTSDEPSAPSSPSSTGLVGLRERLAPLGATLDSGQDGTGFHVSVTYPHDVTTKENP